MKQRSDGMVYFAQTHAAIDHPKIKFILDPIRAIEVWSPIQLTIPISARFYATSEVGLHSVLHLWVAGGYGI